MRECMGLYRGRKKCDGKWIVGTYFRKNTVRIRMPVDAPKRKSILDEPIKFDIITEHFIIPDGYCDYGFKLYIEEYKVDPDTIGECTGVPDKNGTIMFEGDTVKGLFPWEEEILSTVAFRDGSFGLKWMRGNVEMFDPFTSMCNVQYEVVTEK